MITTMPDSLFVDNPDSSFHAHYRDLHRGCGFIDQWYQKCQQAGLLDPEFAQEFKTRTPERAAELLFAIELLGRGVSLSRLSDSGNAPSPDFRATSQDDSSREFYVEITCPTDGDNDGDMITEATTYQKARSGATMATDYDQIKRTTLRMSNALWDKAKSGQAKRAEVEKKPFVVALSTMGFSWPIDAAAIDGEFPVDKSALILRFVYGLDETARFHIPTRQVVIDARRTISKSGGSTVDAGVFLPNHQVDDEFARVSAILFSPWSYFSSPSPDRPNVCLIHNASASCPLPRNCIPNVVEHWCVQETAQFVIHAAMP